jgi:hypothetical protein
MDEGNVAGYGVCIRWLGARILNPVTMKHTSMRNIALFLMLSLFLSTSCKEKPTPTASNRQVEIYMLKSFVKRMNSDAILPTTEIINDTALIKYDDILSYDPKTYTFKVSAKAAKWLSDIKHNPVDGNAFAITIDKKIVYSGYFVTGLSSSVCDWTVINPLNASGTNELTVQLGYPSRMPYMVIPDNRNNKELMETFRIDKRLK